MKTTPKNEWKLTEPHYRDIHGFDFVEAICAHGIGHHNGSHGCDGCCFSWPDEIRDATTKE